MTEMAAWLMSDYRLSAAVAGLALRPSLLVPCEGAAVLVLARATRTGVRRRRHRTTLCELGDFVRAIRQRARRAGESRNKRRRDQ